MRSLDDISWGVLLDRISQQRCTPFLGAGISSHPKGGDIALQWAAEYGYPLADSSELIRVAQFVGVKSGDPMVPKERLIKLFERSQAPDYSDPYNPYGLLADLPFEIYITTNYDNFMVEALRARHRDPYRVVCRWNDAVTKSNTSKLPTVANPWVFHLHGCAEDPPSMVLTEDDYLDFLVRSQRDNQMLPHQIVRALSNTSLLFMGYSLADWTFRILFRGIVFSLPNSLRRIHVAVQLPRSPPEEAYLHEYFSGMKVKVFWGDAPDFVRELRERWESFNVRTAL